MIEAGNGSQEFVSDERSFGHAAQEERSQQSRNRRLIQCHGLFTVFIHHADHENKLPVVAKKDVSEIFFESGFERDVGEMPRLFKTIAIERDV
jgi:hypothetical protein